MIPLNDDSAEKANRQKERTLMQSIQKQKMLAAASPGLRRQTLTGAVEGLPRTPRNSLGGAAASSQGPIDTVTPLRKVPILANFEEMMKMATDNVRVFLWLPSAHTRRLTFRRRKSTLQTRGISP